MPTHIRPATVDDIAAIEAIVHAAYSPYIQRIGRKPGPMLDDYRQQVAAERVHVLESVGQVRGFVVLIHHDEYLLLDNLAVDPGAQGLGYGRLLLGFAERQARHGSIRLYTNEAMTENIALYTRKGYVETHRAEENGLRRVYMQKDLTASH
ncbi:MULTISPECIES: GNAT family N-acetyltransferase [unclassified Pseudomonas]|uniref:GNAT family N-acetyltransferase n=1 Tax=unclassified Pseudomonas TaxID=196821 RepID=UPI000C86B68D|nr:MULTISPECIES: GNAT family N-acetyltransferase [unclassified Pseudomonas]PMU26322.1 GNAT family N-acetyltransferase [Pseudomonas sp. GP01-A9]PMU30688.1 GNAT family N-acetyltransferase [Pseudomonas sp. GP01-A13]PMU42869.1 GNAT family N-acetyltransferase [Pseudomonas sp. GP01-A8]PMU50358.1 GNAT family N-acetyltransferase [Pseudomonas sp. GP01-A14]PMU56357.1 GNAT family N-acetyltransferase [Pseudomonas sp. GP01-A6]